MSEVRNTTTEIEVTDGEVNGEPIASKRLVLDVKDIVTLDNVWLVYNEATLFNTSSIADFCLQFMDRLATEVLRHESTYKQSVDDFKMLITRSTFKTTEEEKNRAIFTFINSNPKLDSDLRNELLSRVNLDKFSDEELLHVVRPTQLLSDSQILDAIIDRRPKSS